MTKADRDILPPAAYFNVAVVPQGLNEQADIYVAPLLSVPERDSNLSATAQLWHCSENGCHADTTFAVPIQLPTHPQW